LEEERRKRQGFRNDDYNASTHIQLESRRRLHYSSRRPRSCRPPRMPGVRNRARRMTWRPGLRLPPTPKPPGHNRQPVPPHTRLR
ncbi:uncharacterized protein SCHCODRAFT_02606833, partial [Schizophyllum commune H4-8]|uniref:uncharacterized protein n=1 Tax=Schizophyllum commune (strain H4-8 / FGSC 9210) TaxID=578458 RepID=UPI00215E4170